MTCYIPCHAYNYTINSLLIYQYNKNINHYKLLSSDQCMSLKDIQNDVDKWTGQFTPQYWLPLEMMARLTEEVGEVARELNNMYGPKKKKPGEESKGLGQELSDVLFTVCCIANSHDIDLQGEWERMMKEKQYGRDNQRYERKERPGLDSDQRPFG